MNGIVIIGHGNFGSGLNSTLELIAGKYDFVKYGDFTSEKSPEEFGIPKLADWDWENEKNF